MSVVNPEGDASSTKPHHSGLETFSIVIPAKDEALDIESVVVEVHTLRAPTDQARDSSC